MNCIQTFLCYSTEVFITHCTSTALQLSLTHFICLISSSHVKNCHPQPIMHCTFGSSPAHGCTVFSVQSKNSLGLDVLVYTCVRHLPEQTALRKNAPGFNLNLNRVQSKYCTCKITLSHAQHACCPPMDNVRF